LLRIEVPDPDSKQKWWASMRGDMGNDHRLERAMDKILGYSPPYTYVPVAFCRELQNAAC